MAKSKKSVSKLRRSKDQIKSEVSVVAQFVRNRREELGYTQDELAFRSGLNPRFIKEFELGKKTVRMDKVTELLEFLGATLEVKTLKGNI
jgi:transcriptional regulator with XRE-family HTH domain